MLCKTLIKHIVIICPEMISFFRSSVNSPTCGSLCIQGICTFLKWQIKDVIPFYSIPLVKHWPNSQILEGEIVKIATCSQSPCCEQVFLLISQYRCVHFVGRSPEKNGCNLAIHSKLWKCIFTAVDYFF